MDKELDVFVEEEEEVVVTGRRNRSGLYAVPRNLAMLLGRSSRINCASPISGESS